MLDQVAIGTGVILASFMIQAFSIGLAIPHLRRILPFVRHGETLFREVAVLLAVMLWGIFSLSLVVWIWAFTFLAVGEFEILDEAVYFAIVSFTTLGFGDVLLSPRWELLSGLCAANGMIAFGVTTAFLVEVLRHMLSRDA